MPIVSMIAMSGPLLGREPCVDSDGGGVDGDRRRLDDGRGRHEAICVRVRCGSGRCRTQSDVEAVVLDDGWSCALGLMLRASAMCCVALMPLLRRLGLDDVFVADDGSIERVLHLDIRECVCWLLRQL